MRPLKEKISITVDSDILERVKHEAEMDDRSLSQYINLVLKDHLRRLSRDDTHHENKQEEPGA